MRYVTQFLQSRLFERTTKTFWLLLTPCSLLALSLILLTKESSALSQVCLISVIGAYLSWKFSLKGFLVAGVSSIIAFSLMLVSSSEPIGLWHWFWMFSLELSLFVTSLASSEYYNAESKDQKRFDEKLEQLEKAQAQALSLVQDELQSYQEEKEQSVFELKELEEKLSSYQSLSVACKEESDKYFAECENFKEQVAMLKDKLSAFESSQLDEKLNEIKVQKQRKELNEIRVANYQYKLIVDNYRKQDLQNSASINSSIQQVGSEELNLQLEKLQDERASLKGHYEEKMRDFEATSEKFKTFFTMNEMISFKDPNGSFKLTYEELNEKLKTLGETLGEMRSEIFKVEGEILEVKKQTSSELEQDPIQSYLTIADQECLRLEKENQALKKHLNELINFESKKPPTDS